MTKLQEKLTVLMIFYMEALRVFTKKSLSLSKKNMSLVHVKIHYSVLLDGILNKPGMVSL